jgi:chromosome partitioning protein
MTAKILTVANQKGGAGKTTLSMSVAGTLGRRGARVLVIDADAQGTARMWAQSADDEKPFPATVVNLSDAREKLHREVRLHIANYDYIVIDCPPSVEAPATQSALLVADVCLIPIPPSPADFWSSRGIKLLVENAQTINDGLKAFVVVNKNKKTALSASVLGVLEDFGLPLLDAKIGDKTAYQEAMIGGSTVQGLGRGARPAVVEIEAVVDELIQRMGWH